MELQAELELDKEWNSAEMLENRRAVWNDRNEADEEPIESVLEFLEKVSTFEKRAVGWAIGPVRNQLGRPHGFLPSTVHRVV